MVLAASAGITLNKHYCMGHLVSIAIYDEADSCMDLMGMEEEGDTCMHCCDDVTEEYKVDDLKLSQHTFDLTPEFQTLCLAASYIFSSPEYEEPPYEAYTQYKPPNINRDIPVFVQSFLI